MTLVAGIDPGKGGGFAVFDLDTGKLVNAGPIEFDRMFSLYDAMANVTEILIERAQAAPKQGISTAFEYGRSFGRIEAVCHLTIRTNRILYCAPSWWKAKLAVPTSKDLAQKHALKRVPGLGKYVTLQKHNGIAEAALIGTVLLDDKLYSELRANNNQREKPKVKRVQYRL